MERGARALDDVFAVREIKRAWKSVRQGLRRQPIADLHDYLDVHRNLEAHAIRLRELVLTGRYRPTPPEITTLEKADGIARRLLLLAPLDALVLQVLVQAIKPVIERRQPTKNAYYSISQSVRKAEHVDGTFGYEWWILWPQFQKRIWEFARSSPFVVVADVANYFDCIPHAPLRNAIAAMGQIDEPVLDLLFYTLEAFAWRPFYLPPAGVGIPQIDIEAPRLLAHAYLFPIDTFLSEKTKNNVVRWMDDIDFGASSKAEARQTLGQLEVLLNRYGVRLNSGKTKILSGKEAVRHFCLRENQRLTYIERRVDAGMLDAAGMERACAFIVRSWRNFKGRRPAGNHEKIRKRYFTICGKLGDDVLDAELWRTLCHAPSSRAAAFHYLRLMGFSPRRLTILERFVLESGACLDDSSLFTTAKVLTTWRIPVGRHTARVRALAEQLPERFPESVTAFLAGLWLTVKYASATELDRYIRLHQARWKRSSWAARQVATALPRLNHEQQRAWSDVLVGTGMYDGVGVLAHYGQIARLQQLDHQLRSYLLAAPTPPYNYELPKVLLALAILNGRMSPAGRLALQENLLAIVDDPALRSMILECLPGAVSAPIASISLKSKASTQPRDVERAL